MLRLRPYGRVRLAVGIPLIIVLSAVLVLVLVLGARARRRFHQARGWRFQAVSTDTTLVRWQQRMLRRVDRLEQGYLEFRNRDVAYTPEQAELARAADSRFRVLRDSLMGWPEAEPYEHRVKRARRIKRMVGKLKMPMGRFKRRMRTADSIARVQAQAEGIPCLTAE
jgi:hypothetical protein